MTAPSYTIQSVAYNNVGGAFGAVDTALSALSATGKYVRVNSGGPAASASGTDAIAIGSNAQATQSGSVAIGLNASSTAASSVAIGSGSTNTAANTVSFGSAGNERRLTNVAAGINQTDAVNVGQLQSTVSGLQNQITSNQQEARRGIVAAVAVAPVLMPSAPGKTTVAFNTGYYRGEAGVGVGVSHRLNFDTPTVVYGSYSNGGGNEHIGRAGMAVEF